jgi:hypothetical protein
MDERSAKIANASSTRALFCGRTNEYEPTECDLQQNTESVLLEQGWMSKSTESVFCKSHSVGSYPEELSVVRKFLQNVDYDFDF